MARRKDHTRVELTELAIDCGREIVVSEGPTALTARNVAARMGYTPGTLYNLFENIEALIIEINIETLNLFAKQLKKITGNTQDPKMRISRIAQAFLDLQNDEPALWELLFATPLQAKSEKYHEAIHRVFDPAVQTLLPLTGNEEEARRDAKILWATLHGICHLKQSGKLDVSEADTPEVLVKQFLSRFLDR